VFFSFKLGKTLSILHVIITCYYYYLCLYICYFIKLFWNLLFIINLCIVKMLCEGLLTVSPRTMTPMFADVEVPSNDYEQIPGFAS
jgi:hypothetical protein